MDDILNTLDDNTLNELAAEPMPRPVQSASLPSPQPQPTPTQSQLRPMARGYYQTPPRRPMMRPTSPSQAAPQPVPQSSQPRPVQPVQPQPQSFQTTAQPMPVSQPVPAQPYQPQAQPGQAPQPRAMQVGVSASSLGLKAKTKTGLPKGLYIIVGLTLLDVAISFISANTSLLYTVATLVDLLLAFGLFTRVNLARQATLAFQAVNICLVILVMVGFMATESRINQLTIKYNGAVAEASIHASPQQEVAIDNLNTQMNVQRRAIGKAIGIDYIRSFIAIGVSAGIIWYLTRPRVKDAFH